MFLRLLSVEWTRLSRHALLWFALAACALYAALSLGNFYDLNRMQLLNGSLKVPGLAFDLANSLDQLLIALPLLVILSAVLTGNDSSQRTNQHWLMHGSRDSSVLAKFAALSLAMVVIQIVTLLAGALTGLYWKTFALALPDVLNVDWLALLAAPFYMTLVNLPYIALALLLAIFVRSTLFSAILGVGYTQILEYLLSGLFHGASWTRWLLTNLHFSVSFLLNAIGSRSVEPPAHILAPASALVTASAYTLGLLALAVWLYRRQDLGG